jgi:CTP:phosphocholine cytidylyltransferase-like protein
MKAYLLAAGIGARLKPHTDTMPKCLIEIAGKPLMQRRLERRSDFHRDAMGDEMQITGDLHRLFVHMVCRVLGAALR